MINRIENVERIKFIIHSKTISIWVKSFLIVNKIPLIFFKRVFYLLFPRKKKIEEQSVGNLRDGLNKVFIFNAHIKRLQKPEKLTGFKNDS